MAGQSEPGGVTGRAPAQALPRRSRKLIDSAGLPRPPAGAEPWPHGDGFNPEVPNVARIYDFLLGGKDNFDADRQAAHELIQAVPGAATAAQDNRAFLRRAVQFLAQEAGI